MTIPRQSDRKLDISRIPDPETFAHETGLTGHSLALRMCHARHISYKRAQYRGAYH